MFRPQGLVPTPTIGILEGFEEALRRAREVRDFALRTLCELPGAAESTLRGLAFEAFNVANARFMVRPTNTTRPSAIQQLINYVTFSLGGTQAACAREALAQANQGTIAGNFANEAAAITLRLLNAVNPQRPALQLSFTFLTIMGRRMVESRLNCLSFLVNRLGIAQNVAGSICAQTGNLTNPPAEGITIAVPRGFSFSDALINLAKFASGILIQPPPARPTVTRQPSIQIAPPIR